MRLKNGYHFQKKYLRILFAIIDKIGVLLISLFINKTYVEKIGKKKILLCKNDHLGDVALFLQVLPIIRKIFKADEIHLVVGSWAKELVIKNPYIDKVLVYDSFLLNRDKGFFKRIWRAVITSCQIFVEMRKNRYDIGIDFRAYFPNMVPLLFLGRISWRVGYPTGGFGFLLSKQVIWREDISEREHFVDLIKIFGEVFTELNFNLDYLINMDKTKQILTDINISENEKFVIIHPVGGTKTKMWKIESWKKVITFFVDKDIKILIIGSNDKKNIIQYLVNEKVINLTNKTDFSLLDIRGP